MNPIRLFLESQRPMQGSGDCRQSGSPDALEEADLEDISEYALNGRFIRKLMNTGQNT